MKTLPKLKICGMKHAGNIQDIAALQPDYLGFIFYKDSARNFEANIPEINDTIQKVGVFVDAPIDFIIEKVNLHQLSVIQLHGQESDSYCNTLRLHLGQNIHLWKVFSIKDSFNFDQLTPYESIVNAFLFDTKGKHKGGNGYTFDWSVLKEYHSSKPFILSGGIGLQELPDLIKILATELPILAIDVNSKFEIEPGFKRTRDLKLFQEQLYGAS